MKCYEISSSDIYVKIGKNNFAEVSANLDGYKSENNFVGPSK